MERYRFKLDLNHLNSHSKIIDRIKPESTILEIGTAYGHMTEYMKENLKCKITGIEIDSNMLKEAEAYLNESINLNVDNTDKLDNVLRDDFYDYIILADVLEHCYKPVEILKVLKNKIKNDGKIIISIPNAAHNSILMELLKGAFSYQNEGILDYTHIRFYTRDSFKFVVEQIGYSVVEYDYTYMVPEYSELNTFYRNQTILEREVLIKHLDGHVFQNIFVLMKDEGIKCREDIIPISSENYDEIYILEDGIEEEKIYIHEEHEHIEYELKKKSKKIEIIPTIRFRKYSIDIYINKEYIKDYFLFEGYKNNNEITNIGENKIVLNYDFKENDKIDIYIKYKNISETEMLNTFYRLNSLEERENYNMNKEMNQLMEKVAESQIVSFDVFDTLLFRNVVKPTDIFKIVEKKYFNLKHKYIDFHDLRIEAECKARENSNEEDITLEEIYKQLEYIYNKDVELLKNLEIESEKEFLIANKDMKSVFDYCKRLGKTIYIISDMYLSTNIIKELLKINGYEDYDKIYVSSDLKHTKATSSIYKFIREENNIDKLTKWIHIGDNKQADVINAKLQGVEGYYYQRRLDMENIDNVKNLSDSICKAVQINMKNENKDKGYWYKFGIEYVFPVYIGFSKWILDLMMNKDNIYFLARDGYIPYTIYNKLRKGNKYFPEGKYLFASRRAYQYPHMLKIEKNIAIEILTAFNSNLGQKITLGEIFRNIGLNQTKYIDIINKFGINSFEETIEYGKSLHNVRKFLCYIWDDICVKLKEEELLLDSYFEKEKLKNYNCINIVDIGWRGSTQLAIKDLLCKNVQGYYFGTMENMYPQIMSESYGYAFDLGVTHERKTSVMDNVMMYELIFSAPHGSLIKFEQSGNGDINPVLKNVEGNSEIYNIIKDFQLGALDVVDKIIPYIDYIETISKEYSLDGFEEFIKRKNIKDLIEFSKISNSVGFGDSKDIKSYVDIVEIKEYELNKNLTFEKAKYSLWKNAMIIRDNEGRLFSIEEFDKDRFNKYIANKKLRLKDIVILLKKAINNPRKAITRLQYIIKECK